MDVVERVHDEVRINLVAQVIQFLLQALLLELGQVLFLLLALAVGLHAQVGSHHHNDEDEHGDVVPVDGRTPLGRRRLHLNGIFRLLAL